MAERTGLEPATPGVTGRYSNQLNYRSEEARTLVAQIDSVNTFVATVVGAAGFEPATPGL